MRPEGSTIESVHRMPRWLRNQVRTMPFTARAPTSLSVPLARMAARPVRPPCSGAYAALAVQTAGRSSSALMLLQAGTRGSPAAWHSSSKSSISRFTTLTCVCTNQAGQQAGINLNR